MILDQQCHRCGAPQGPPDTVHFWYMRDNHSFAALRGESMAEVLSHARDVADADGGWGMVCGAILLRDKQEIRRVNARIHIKSMWGEGEKFEAMRADYIAAHEGDADVMRLLRGPR